MSEKSCFSSRNTVLDMLIFKTSKFIVCNMLATYKSISTVETEFFNSLNFSKCQLNIYKV